MTDRANGKRPLPLNHDASAFDSGSWVGRVWLPEQGPAVVLVKAGAVSAYGDPAQMATRIRTDFDKWGQVIRDKQIVVN